MESGAENNAQAGEVDPSTIDPRNYVWATCLNTWDNLPLILLAGFAFSVLCAPAFVLLTVGWVVPGLLIGALSVVPGWIALLDLQAVLVQGRSASLGKMMQAFPYYWWRSMRLGAFFIVPCLAAIFTFPLLNNPIVPVPVWLGLAADLLGILVVWCLALYACPLLVLYDLPVAAVVRNSVILASRHIINTCGLLSMAILSGFAVVYISLGLLFVLPGCYGMFVVNNCRLVLAEELIDAK